MSSHEVVIAGAGPVGMVAALRLGQAGVPVTVLEAGDDLALDSKASTFHIPSLELLDTLGIGDTMHEQGLRAPVFQQRERHGGVLAELDLGVLSDVTRFPYRLQLEQNKLTRIIRPILESMDHVELRFGVRADRAEDRGDRAALFVDGSDEPLETDWLLGCDGANSMVRQSLGFGFEGVTFPERFLVMSTSHEFRDSIPDLAHVAYINDPDEWVVLLRTPDHWRVLMPVPAEESDEAAVSDARIQARLHGLVRLDHDVEVLQHSLYRVHQRVASTFSQRRVLLAGDSAHMNNPLGGMGMNSGIHDAWSAVDTILAVRDGADADKASHIFGQVRAETCHEYVQAMTTSNFRDMQEKDREAREARNTMIRGLVDDPAATRTYLLRTSMLTSARESIARVQRELASL